MSHNIEISSLIVNKLKNSHEGFIKYDIDVALDEVENNESGIKIKYKIALLSNPTNTKLIIEGLVSLVGNESEISKQLESDQKNIPVIVNVIYQDIFPLIYIISQRLQIPCPAYKLAQIVSTPKEAKHEEIVRKSELVEQSDNDSSVEKINVKQIEPSLEPVNESIIQEAKVSSI